jgi:hypothetical protein
LEILSVTSHTDNKIILLIENTIHYIMNKIVALLPVVVAIFALMLSPAVMSVSAEKGGNDKAQGEPKGCDNGKGKDNINNPNCENGTVADFDNDGIPDSVEIPHSCLLWDNPDTDGDGVWDGQEELDGTDPCTKDQEE